MRIVKEGATLYHELVTHGEMREYYHDSYKVSDTIEINLERFIQWYYDKWWRKDGGMISFKDVPALMTEFIKDMEAK
jgi:hypothetical protein